VVFAEDEAQLEKLKERRDDLPNLEKVVLFDGPTLTGGNNWRAGNRGSPVHRGQNVPLRPRLAMYSYDFSVANYHLEQWLRGRFGRRALASSRG
jgi:hypothetical protein